MFPLPYYLNKNDGQYSINLIVQPINYLRSEKLAYLPYSLQDPLGSVQSVSRFIHQFLGATSQPHAFLCTGFFPQGEVGQPGEVLIHQGSVPAPAQPPALVSLRVVCGLLGSCSTLDLVTISRGGRGVVQPV